jgi:polysaccharide biosynthesis transport protein
MNMDQFSPVPNQRLGNQRDVVPVDGNGAPDIYRHNGGSYPYYPTQDLQADTPSGFDFYKYLRIVTKYRWLIVGIILTSLLSAIALTLLMTPIYRATSSIQIDREAMNIVKVDSIEPEGGQGGLEFYQTQYELLGSRSLAERVTSTLGLATDATFNTETTSPLSFVKKLVFGAKKEETEATEVSQELKTRKTVDRLSASLTVAPVRGSRIVKVSVDHTNPAVAQRIADGYAEAFIADNLDRRFEATSYARKFLEERLAQLKGRLEDSEKQLVKYAEDQGIIRLDDNKNLSATDLQAINEKLGVVRGERSKKEQMWKQAQATSGLGLKQILDSDAIKANRKLRTELAAEYQQKLAIFKPAFPAMQQLRNQIKELDRQVENEVVAIKQSIESEYLESKQEEADLEAQLANSKTEVVDQRNRSIQYNIIQREVDTNRTLYDGLLQRYKEIGLAGGVGTNNVSIVDRATLPLRPRSPRMLVNVALALLGGLILGIMSAIGLDYLDDSFKSPEDIEREIGLPVVGIIPKPKPGVTVDDELIDARSAMAEAYRSLRTGLQFSTSDGLPRTLLVTSSKPSEGKTTTTISLAKALAHIGLDVLLIDGDLRNASVHKRLRCGNELGLSNYLSGSKQPEEVVQSTDVEGLVLMSSGPLPPNPAELLTGPRLPSLLALASQSFDIVLIDGPPVMGLADAPLLSSAIQATLLVVAANETRRSTVKIALKRLQFARANIVGALLNKFDAKQTGYGYGYGYGDYEYHSYGNTPQLPSAQG